MDILNLSVRQIVEKIKNAEITSVELCKLYIERIKKFEKDIKAWAHFDEKILLEKAHESDEFRKSGNALGPLHGVPVALKDIVGTYDMPTECGTPIRKGKSASQNAEIVDLLKSSGALIMGKTATSELAFLSPPKTRNPHDYNRTPGGSSSGSAAVIASHMAPLSIGSQTGGSIIRPASYCGVVGYKPSYGLISRNGVLRTSSKLDHIGVFGKKVEDVALLAKILIKKDSYDEASVHYSSEHLLTECLKDPIYEPKFIFYKTKSWNKVDKKSRESFEFFIKSFKKNIEIFDTPSYFERISKYHKLIHEVDLANNFSDYYKNYRKKLSKEMINAIQNGMKHSAKEYAEAIDFMKRSYDSYKEVFEDYYAVLTPSSTGVADKGLKSTGSADFNRVWSFLGTPSISLPLLQGENNLPLGIQMVGAKYDDHRFLSTARWLETKSEEYNE